MDKRIIYQTEDGGIAVIVPSPKAGVSIEQIAAKDVPPGRTYRIVDASEIPTDRTYRNAWEPDFAEPKKVKTDMTKAREIHRNYIRQARAPKLQELDIEFMRAAEVADTAKMNSVAAKKQALRDATADPAIEAAATTEDLKRCWPADLGPNPLLK